MRRDHRLAAQVAAALGPDLVLDRDRREPGLLEGAGDEMHVQRVAVAGVGIGEQRDVAAVRQRPAGAQVLVEREDAAIRPAEHAFGNARAGDRRRLVAETLHQPHAVAVEHAGKHQDVRAFDELSEQAAVGHGEGKAVVVSLMIYRPSVRSRRIRSLAFGRSSMPSTAWTSASC